MAKHQLLAFTHRRVIRIAFGSVLAGIVTGLVGGFFRLCLEWIDVHRGRLIAFAHLRPYIGWLLPLVGVAACATVARYLVKRFAPEAAGSGLHRVEAYLRGQTGPAKAAVLPVKFFGGLAAIGSGLALGREGPTVQMGAVIGRLFAKMLVAEEEDQKVTEAAAAGAGLAVAFNAPIGGSVFVFEELTSNFTPWFLVATLSSATVAVAVMRLMMGNHLEFTVPPSSRPQPGIGLFLALGAVFGVVGALYDATILALLEVPQRLKKVSTFQWAAIVGAVVGLLAWFAPNIVWRRRPAHPAHILGRSRASPADDGFSAAVCSRNRGRTRPARPEAYLRRYSSWALLSALCLRE